MSLSFKIRHYHSLLRVCIPLNFRSEKRACSSSAVLKEHKLNPFKKRTFFKNDYNYEKTRVCVTILGNGAHGQPRCLGLFTNNKTFLFNCGEGVNRLLKEYDGAFSDIKHVFITQNNWNNLSGLSDIYITLETYGIYRFNIIGPPGIEHFRSLITSEIRTVQTNKKETPVINDTFEVNSICIHADHSNNTKKSIDDIVFSYAVKILKMPTELIPEKLVEHNVPVGPHLIQLKNGEDVILPCGRTIHAVDVIDSLNDEEILLVADCPSEKFLLPFSKNEEFSQYQLPSDTASKVSTIFHFTPPLVVNTKIYQDWMHSFHPKVQHIILNASCPPVSSEVVYQMQSILHHLNPDIFKLLPKPKIKNQDFSESSSVIYAPPMLQINYRPQKQFNRGNVVNYVPENYIQDTMHFPEFTEEVHKLKSETSSDSKFSCRNGNQSYPKVVFLGTCSSTSSAYRNVSAILLNINSKTNILLDCGEGTFMQFVRYYGAENVDMELRKISCIFISHLHTDHYMGLFLLLQERIEAFKRAGCVYQPVALILPFQIHAVFKQFCAIFDPILKKVRIFNCRFLKAGMKSSSQLQAFLGGIEIETVRVKHCYDAYGIVLKKGADWKIVYSGDSAPCQKLIDAGKNCTLLIHEASIEDDCVNEANARKHSTPSQVIEIAEMMNAQHTILTHFSKRYLAIPIFDNTNKNVGCAFDFMKVELHQLPLVPLFLPAMKCLFPEQMKKHSERSSFVVNFEKSFMKHMRANSGQT